MHWTVLERAVGQRPTGLEARHLNDDSLDNTRGNLAWGTRRENARDAVVNGVCAGLASFGENNGRAILTEDQVIHIRREAANGRTGADIAREYNVTRWAINRVVSGRTWKYLPMPAMA
jgi:hypothetical protein